MVAMGRPRREVDRPARPRRIRRTRRRLDERADRRRAAGLGRRDGWDAALLRLVVGRGPRRRLRARWRGAMGARAPALAAPLVGRVPVWLVARGARCHGLRRAAAVALLAARAHRDGAAAAR